MLKITRLSDPTLKVFKADNNKVVDSSNSKTNETVVNLSRNNKSRNSTYMPNIEAMGKPNFLIFNTKKIFNYLRQAFIKASIV